MKHALVLLALLLSLLQSSRAQLPDTIALPYHQELESHASRQGNPLSALLQDPFQQLASRVFPHTLSPQLLSNLIHQLKTDHQSAWLKAQFPSATTGYRQLAIALLIDTNAYMYSSDRNAFVRTGPYSRERLNRGDDSDLNRAPLILLATDNISDRTARSIRWTQPKDGEDSTQHLLRESPRDMPAEPKPWVRILSAVDYRLTTQDSPPPPHALPDDL